MQWSMPAHLAIEDCTMTRFYGGGMQAPEDGSWLISLEVHDDNYGDWGYEDKGEGGYDLRRVC